MQSWKGSEERREREDGMRMRMLALRKRTVTAWLKLTVMR